MTRRGQALLGLLLLVPVPTLGAYAGLVGAPGPLGQAVFGVSKLWILVFPALWVHFVEKGSLRPNLSTRGWSAGVITGVVGFVAIIAFHVLVASRVFDLSSFAPRVLAAGIDGKGTYIALALYWTFVNSLIEEYVWRWFVASRLEILTSRGVAIVLSAALFSVHHFVALTAFVTPQAAAIGTLGVFVAAVVWSWLYLRFRSLLAPYVSHVLADAAIFLVGWFVIFG
jgi:membrane protease YdiL (CAAX protease family)